MNYFILLLICLLIVIYMSGFFYDKEKFVSGYDSSDLMNEPVNYSTRNQNCDELTYTPEKCVVNTVIPSNKSICTKSLNHIKNNEIDSAGKNQNESKNKTLDLTYDFDLLSSFNNSQIENNLNHKNKNDELESFDDLKTDVRSLNSIENDIMSNY